MIITSKVTCKTAVNIPQLPREHGLSKSDFIQYHTFLSGTNEGKAKIKGEPDFLVILIFNL